MTAFYVLSAVMFLLFLGGGISIPLFPLYAQSLGASLVQVSWIAGGNATVTLAANLIWGRLSDRLGRRKPFLVGAMATLAVTNLLAAQASVWSILLTLRLVEGAAFGAYAVASLALLGDILEDNPHRARLVALSRMAGSLAFSIAVVSAGVISERLDLPTIYRLASGIFFLAFLMSLALPESHQSTRPAERRVSASFAELARGPMLPLLAVAASFNVPFSSVYFAAWPIWVSEGLGLGRATFSLLWGLAAFVEVPSLAVSGLLTERYGRRLTFILGMAAFAVVYALYLLVAVFGGVPIAFLPFAVEATGGVPGQSALAVLVLAQLLRGFGLAAFTATSLTMAVEVSPPESRGKAAGLYAMAESVSNIAGNYAGGPIAQSFGYSALYAGASCAVLLGAVYVRLAVGRSAERSPERA